MLETLETLKKVDKDSYLEWFPRLKTDLRDLQQKVREAGVPVIVLFDGVRLSGKHDSIRHLTETLDPRGFSVHSTDSTHDEEERRQWLWRFWIRLPARGKFSFFGNTWYTRALHERLRGRASKDAWSHALQEIVQTEEMLARDGALVAKFWLHISRKELKRRLKQAEEDPYSRVRVTKDDWHDHDDYDKYCEAAEELLERSSTHLSPWTIVEAGDHRFRRMKVFQTLSEQLVSAINEHEQRKALRANSANDRFTVPVLKEMPTILDKVDLQKKLSQEEYEQKKIPLQVKLRRLQYEAIERGDSMVVVYEGWDAAGKGGSIRRLTATLDPQYYDVIPISKPSPEELAHHYLWRFWKYIPKSGHMTLFDRSWYGRVLVERIEGFCTEDEWRRAYQEINEFELQLYRANIALVKLWLHISPEEQLRRFQAREKDPHKAHKLNEEDWRNRDRWNLYRESVDDMIKRTSTTHAPWVVIEGDCKRHARVRAMESVIRAFEEAQSRHKGAHGKKKG